MMCLIFVFITNLETSCVKTSTRLFCFDLCVFLAFPFLATFLANCRFLVRTCWIDKKMRAMFFFPSIFSSHYLTRSFLWVLSECLYTTVLGRAIFTLYSTIWIVHVNITCLENAPCGPKIKIRIKFMIVSHRKIPWDLK